MSNPPSVAIRDFDVIGIAVPPFKTDSPLIVYPDTPLAFTVAGKLFESISRRYPKKV
jgi:hypothetical protein